MYRRGGTGFLLAFILVGFFHALADVAKGLFDFFVWLVSGIACGVRTGSDLGRRSTFDAVVNSAVEPYLQTLVSKRQRLLRADEYGVIDQMPWAKELNYFLNRVLFPNLGGFEGYARRNLYYTANLVDGIVSEHQPLPPG